MIPTRQITGKLWLTEKRLVSNEEIRRHPELNSLTGLCVDAVVEAPRGAHPSQCFGCYDYDSQFYLEYDQASKTQEAFDVFVQKYITDVPTHEAYLDLLGAARLLSLNVKPGYGYVPGLKRR